MYVPKIELKIIYIIFNWKNCKNLNKKIEYIHKSLYLKIVENAYEMERGFASQRITPRVP